MRTSDGSANRRSGRASRWPLRRAWLFALSAVVTATVLSITAQLNTASAGTARQAVPASVTGGGLSGSTALIKLIAATSAMQETSAGPTVSSASPVGAPPASAGFVTRSGSGLFLAGNRFRFAGANEYYLGLDDNVPDSSGMPTYPTKAAIDDALRSAVATGATVVRSHTLGVSVGCSSCLEPRLGVFNDGALVAADYAIFRAGQLGLKLMIPLTDQWRWYHGGESVFTGWAGYPNDPNPSVNAANSTAQRESESHFYSDPAIRSSFRVYVAHLLNHVNPYNALAYKNDPTILAWETGNELWTADEAWTQSLAQYLKHTVGARQLVADGSAADGMSVSGAAVDAPDIDIVGGHFYPVDIEWMRRDASVAAAHGKAYVVGEFDWTNPGATAALIAAVQGDPNIAGDLYWTLMPHLAGGAPEPHGDGFAMYTPAVDANMSAVLTQLTAHARWMAAAG